MTGVRIRYDGAGHTGMRVRVRLVLPSTKRMHNMRMRTIFAYLSECYKLAMATYTRATSLEERSKSTQTEEKNAPEKNPLPWKIFYMSVAELESQRSNCSDAERVSAIRQAI